MQHDSQTYSNPSIKTAQTDWYNGIWTMIGDGTAITGSAAEDLAYCSILYEVHKLRLNVTGMAACTAVIKR